MDTSMNLDSLKSYALPLAAVVVVVAAVPLAIMPWFGDITASWEKISVESARRDALTTKADALEKFDVTDNKAILQDTVLPAVPADMDPAGLLGTIEQVARTAGAGIQGVTYSEATVQALPIDATAPQVEGMNYVTVSVSIEGTYEQIAGFIARSEKVSRIVTLDTLHIVKGEDGNPNIASFDIRSPYIPHPENLALEDPFQELGPSETAIIDRIIAFDDVEYTPTDVSSIVGKNNPF